MLHDDELFARFRATRDPAALAEVFDRTAPDLLRIVRHLSGDAAEAEDLVQVTFLAAIERADRWDTQRGLFPWLVGILTNQARLARRRAARTAAALARGTDMAPDPAHQAAARELADSVTTAIAELPETYRPVLRMHLGHGLQAREIAAKLARPAGTIRTQIARGLELLRKALPAGFATSVVVSTNTRGLAAVREAVLQGSRSITASATLALGGTLMAKKLWLSCVALLAGAVTGWFVWQEVRTRQPVADELDRASPIVASRTGGGHDEAVSTRSTTGEHASARSSVASAPSPLAQAIERYTASVRGEVVDEQGQAVPGAEIVAVRHGTIGFDQVVRVMAHSDARGRFDVGRTTQAWVYSARKVGHAPSGGAMLVATGDGAIDTSVTLVLPRASGEVTGRVVDAEGTPVPGADVILFTANWEFLVCGSDGSPRSPFAPLRTPSDAHGTFRFANAPLGGWTIAARAPGFRDAQEQVLVQPVVPTQTILRLTRGASVHGEVRDADGAPVVEAPVHLTALTSSEAHRAVTNARGGYRFESVPAAPVRVDIRPSTAPGEAVPNSIGGSLEDPASGATHARTKRTRGSATRDLVLADGQSTQCDLTLRRPVGIHGRLRDTEGNPLAGWTVQAFRADFEERHRKMQWDHSFRTWSYTVDAEGRFAFDDLPSREHALQVGMPGSPVGFGPIVRERVAPGADEIDLRIAPAHLRTGTVRGVVLTPGDNAGTPSVTITRHGAVDAKTFPCGGDGSFQIAGLPAGTYRLSALSSRHVSDKHELTLSPGEHRELGRIPLGANGSVTVRLLHHNGSPWTAGAGLWLHGRGASSDSWVPLPDTRTTGLVTWTSVRPGSYMIVGNPGGLVLGYTPVEVRAGQETKVDVRVAPGTLRMFRFTVPPEVADDDATWLQLTVRDAEGKVCCDQRWRRRSVGEGNLKPYFEAATGLLPGQYVIEGTSGAGLRYRHPLAVKDLTPDERVITIAPEPRWSRQRPGPPRVPPHGGAESATLPRTAAASLSLVFHLLGS